jgi:hypothetical protein
MKKPPRYPRDGSLEILGKDYPESLVGSPGRAADGRMVPGSRMSPPFLPVVSPSLSFSR